MSAQANVAIDLQTQRILTSNRHVNATSKSQVGEREGTDRIAPPSSIGEKVMSGNTALATQARTMGP